MDFRQFLLMASISFSPFFLGMAFVLWAEGKGWIEPSGGFRRLFYDNYTGQILSRLHGRHPLSFTGRKKAACRSGLLAPGWQHGPRALRPGKQAGADGPRVEVVLTSGSLSLEFRDKEDGTVVRSWRNGDPGNFTVSLRPGQTVSLYGQAVRFTGSICFRRG